MFNLFINNIVRKPIIDESLFFYRNQMHYNYKSDEKILKNIDSQKHTPHWS